MVNKLKYETRMGWSYIELPGGDLEKDVYAAMEPTRWSERFMKYVGAHGHPETGFGVFSREEGIESERVHRSYFTPEAEAWGRTFNAIPCDKPDLKVGKLSLSTGPNGTWGIHYPDR